MLSFYIELLITLREKVSLKFVLEEQKSWRKKMDNRIKILEENLKSNK
jgi:hypothetical protein